MKEEIDKPVSKSKELAKLKIWDEKEIILKQERVIRRLTIKTIFINLIEALNIDKGLLFTMKELTIHPGRTIKAYIDTDRINITNPVKYFLLIIGLTIFIASINGYYDLITEEFMAGLNHGMSVNEGDAINAGKSAFMLKMESVYLNYFMKYQNILYAISIVFSSLFSYLFFKKSGYNFIENVVINSYIFTHTFLFFSLIVIFKLDSQLWMSIYVLIFFVYTFIVLKQVFQRPFFQTFFKTIAISLISGILFMLLLTGIMAVWAFKYIKENPELVN